MKKFLLAWLVVFVLAMGTDFLVHGLALRPDYLALPNLMRTEADSQQYFHWMLIAHAMMSGAFVWIYEQGHTNRPWVPQGLRYGLAMACLFAIPTFLIYYVVQPTPALLVAKQCAFDTLRLLALGVAVAAFYK